MQENKGPIGVFDSGYGGLTILKDIAALLPQYDYLYLGDNARTPYGSRSFETVYHYTLECVKWFFEQGCSLVILACNTASAKALRTIQQKDLPVLAPNKRVLGVIRPTAEIIGQYSLSKQIGILGTQGTVLSQSYPIEIQKFFPEVTVWQQACPMWVPLIENNEHLNEGANYFVNKYIQQLLQQNANIDTILLACTHYPLLYPKIKAALPAHIQVIMQGNIVAQSLQNYLQRHPEIEAKCTQNGRQAFYTTDDDSIFEQQATLFYGSEITAQQIDLG
ncbi:glutamate racemase [Hydrotalea sandarakina]|jgi:glutamate racemase|uniref:Glutamate racemase n=1 Tax=Hydrotalea sandarakina TaxID=1004304 RepID=A0A2W7RPX9_9BACT|nr:glutamate racemase [Hydrotalea sandarakina]PZX62808.1 glutamate racemase [Hydrotalea sandarakina]